MANSALVKSILYKSLAEGVYKDVVSRSSSYYYFLGKTLKWSDENNPPEAVDSYEYERDVRNEIITIKEIKPSDVAFVIPRKNWISDFIYDMYDDQYCDQVIGVNIVSGGQGYIDPTTITLTFTGGGATGADVATAVVQEVVDGQISKITLTHRGANYVSTPEITVESPSGVGAILQARIGMAASGVQKLEDANFYVVTDEYNVYKCLDNNNNSRSKNKPTGTQLDPITTADGYVWKFMYNIPINLRNKFYTDDYIPVVSALTNQFYSNGTVDNIFIANKGQGYTSANITVDGDGYREADPIYIDSISVDNEGTGYINPTVQFGPPITTASSFIANTTVNLGQTIVTNEFDYYEVITPGTLSNVPPTHKYGVVLNGNASLKYVGSRIKGTVVLKNNKNITQIVINTGGSSYTEPPLVTIVDSTGANASAVAKIGSSGIGVVNIIAGGSGYVSPTLTVVTAPGDTGYGATLIPVVTGGAITDVVIVTPGFDYKVPPTVVVTDTSGGTGANLSAELSGSPVLSIDIVNGGNGYSSPFESNPGVGTISVSGKNVTGNSSLFTTQLLPNQILKTVDDDFIGVIETITDNTHLTLRDPSPITLSAGTVYNVWSGPTVYISGGGGAGAGASAVVETGVIDDVILNGSIREVIIDKPGSGYINAPEVVVGVPVESVTIIDGGRDYTEPPQVILSDGGGFDGTAHAELQDGLITSITMTNNGSNYGIPPIVSINDPTGLYATAEAVLSGSPVVGTVIRNGGSGYITAPAVTFSDPESVDGVRAAGSAVISGAGITDVFVTYGGSGYKAIPAVVIETALGDSGNGATVSALMSGSGVTGVSLTSGGSGYNTATVTFSMPPNNGSRATGEAVILGGVIIGITLTNAGSGYVEPPTVTITGNGSGATATATVNTSSVVGFDILTDGSGYKIPPLVAIYTENLIDKITVTNGGSGYTSAPTVVIADGSGGEGTGAVATASVSNGVVTGVTVVKTGYNYTSPQISFTGGNGSGAAATATTKDAIDVGGDAAEASTSIGTSSVTSINVYEAGSGYTSPPVITIADPESVGGETATATSNINKSSISSIKITSAGRGYTNPTIVITTASGDTGSGAAATAEYNDGVITAIIVDDGGNGYYQSPDVIIIGDGIGAVAKANLLSGRNAVIKSKLYADKVISTTVVDPGENYSILPTVTFGVQAEKAITAYTNDQFVNGNYLYTTVENGVIGSKLPTHISGTQYTSDAWVATTAVTYGETVYTTSNRALYEVIIEGTTGSTAPVKPAAVNDTIVNGTATLRYLGEVASMRRDGDAAKGSVTMRYGAGYSVTPTVTILDTFGSGASLSLRTSRSTAKISPVIEDGQISFLVVEDPGIGYTKASLDVISGSGDGAELIPDLSLGNVSSQQANNEILTPSGTIDAIAVVSGGYSYGVANVIIEGDGEGATATAEIDPVTNAIVKVHITNRGQNYTYANVKVIGNQTSNGAVLRAIISPYGGHGKNCPEEFFSRTLMFYSNISTDLNQGVVVGNDYRQVGIIKDPRIVNGYQRYQASLGSACYLIQSPIDVTDPMYTWTSGMTISSRTYIWYNNNVYRVVTPGTGGTTPPTHTEGVANNGTATLEFIIQSAYQNIFNNFNRDDDIYIERISTPGTEWEPSLQMTQGDFIWTGERIYSVIVTGLGGSFAPTSTTGVEENGSAVLTYVGSTKSQKRYRIVSVSSKSALVQSLDNDVPQANDIFIKTNSINDKFTAVNVGLPDFDKYSGQMMYIDNKQGFTPSSDETITLRTIIKF